MAELLGEPAGEFDMRAFSMFVIAASFYAVGAEAQSTTYTQIGNTVFGSDGTTYTTIGNTTFGSNGTSYNTIGNTTFGSNGTSYNTIGNTTFGSNGTTAQTIGNSTFINGPSGQSVCITIGTTVFCD